MQDVTDVMAGIDLWSRAADADRRGDRPGTGLGRAIADGLRLHRRVRDLADGWSDPRAPLDPEQARAVEALFWRWVDAAKRVAADVARAESADGGPVDGAAALDRSILYAQHVLSLSADDAVRQQNRIAQEGFRRGVTTEDLRRELLQGRVGS